MESHLISTIDRLHRYCREEQWSGYDPYDALNSRVFAATPFARSRYCRIAMTQLLKRLSTNVRPLLGIAKAQNPKALALFLAAAVRRGEGGAAGEVRGLVERLAALRSPGQPSWGYSFPWQTRSVLVPRHAPNLVCTCFVAEALLEAFDAGAGPQSLEMAVKAAEYVHSLHWAEGDAAGFSYPTPGQQTRVHNANLLAAALLCRVYRHTGNAALLEPALAATRYSVRRQREDGSWAYGELPTQQWIDNFHTGYNLQSLRSIGRSLGSTEFDEPVRRGFAFYRQHFVRADGVVPYFHDRVEPIDSHCVAQTILTLADFADTDEENLALAQRTVDWALASLWDTRGFFHYRLTRFGRNRISYMRWTQAWMLLALVTLQRALERRSAPRGELVNA